MRRLVALVAGAAVLAAGCSNTEGGGERDAAKAGRPTSTSVVTHAPTSTADAATASCGGIGRVPDKPQITVVNGDGLYAMDDDGSARCLIRGDQGSVKWAPTGNRVLFDGKVHYSSGRAATAVPEIEVGWSLPRGTSFVGLNDGCLQKWPTDGGELTRAGFADCGIDSFAYHPAGKHIAIGAQGPDNYGIYIATNTGEGMRLVTRGESATRTSEMEFTQDGERLYFVAVHDGSSHVHRLDLNTAKVESLATATAISALVVSPIGGVAWMTGDCTVGRETAIERRGRRLALPPELRGKRVIGWLTADTVVFVSGCGPGAGASGGVYRWSPGQAVETLASEVYDAAIRTPLPPPPGPPPRKVFDIPESKAPA